MGGITSSRVRASRTWNVSDDDWDRTDGAALTAGRLMRKATLPDDVLVALDVEPTPPPMLPPQPARKAKPVQAPSRPNPI
jgi:hypothetical protein